jgi:hypothetical protein
MRSADTGIAASRIGSLPANSEPHYAREPGGEDAEVLRHVADNTPCNEDRMVTCSEVPLDCCVHRRNGEPVDAM